MRTDLVESSPPPLRGSGLRVEVARSLEGLRAFAEQWDQLAAKAPQRLPNNSYAWMASHFEHVIAPGASWACLFALEGEQLVGVVPVVLEPHTILGLNQPRLRTPYGGETFSVDFLVARGRENEIIPVLLDALHRQYPVRYDFALRRIADYSPTLGTLKAGLNGQAVVREEVDPGSYLPIGKSFEAYQGTLNPRFKRNLARARTRLAELPEVRTVFLTGPEATEKELDRFVEVEASGWKGKAGSAIKLKPKLLEFYRDLTRRLGQRGWLEWHFLLFGECTLAGHLALRTGRNLALLKIGYNEEFSGCSPGTMLLERTVERAIAGGDTDEIDCLFQVPWHENWGMQKRSYYDLWLFPHRFLSLAGGALPKKAKARLRQMPRVVAAYQKLRQFRAGTRSA